MDFIGNPLNELIIAGDVYHVAPNIATQRERYLPIFKFQKKSHIQRCQNKYIRFEPRISRCRLVFS
ncbi:hypothetical protein BDW_03375 [Bdellovibrio bacteriovorus W]|nr:hypothetical protein BDW_03375 [Bdellovibrio bacteriovorus W]